MRTGIAQLPLHGGKAPAWLFQRMVKLAREVLRLLVEECGPREVLVRLSDPFWFQAFDCVLGFDWHSSGVTTTVCGAVSEAVSGREADYGLFVAGGKGRRSRRTPEQIRAFCDGSGLDGEALVWRSRVTAKVDSAAVQDGYQVYQHTFLCTLDGGGKTEIMDQDKDVRCPRLGHVCACIPIRRQGIGDRIVMDRRAGCAQRMGGIVAEVIGQPNHTRAPVFGFGCGGKRGQGPGRA